MRKEVQQNVTGFCGLYRKHVKQIRKKFETASPEELEKWSNAFQNFMDVFFEHDDECYRNEKEIHTILENDDILSECVDGHWRTPQCASSGGPASTRIFYRWWLKPGDPKYWILTKGKEKDEIIGEYALEEEVEHDDILEQYAADPEWTRRYITQIRSEENRAHEHKASYFTTAIAAS